MSTVSRVLRGLPGTSQAARDAVDLALNGLGAARDTANTDSAAGAPTLLAVVQEAPVGTEVDAFESLHLSLVRRLFRVGHAAVRVLTGPGIATAAAAARERGVCGAIVLGGGSAGVEAAQFQAAGIPVVRVSNAPHPGAQQIVLDSGLGIATALRHLVHLGHRRIGLAVPADSAANDRIAVFRRTLAETIHIMATRDQAPVVTAAAGMLGGAQAGRELLAARCTAIISAAPSITFGVLEASKRSGLRVPDDLSLLTVGELPDAEVLSPPLSQVTFDWQALAEAAVRELERLIADPSVTIDYAVAPELVLRASAQQVRTR